MVNSNPETVSTDFDISDKLYFEPLTTEDVIEILETEKQNGALKGVIVQFGGQTPLKLARALYAAGVPIIGTTPDAIDRAEDRERFQQMIQELGLKQPPNRTARTPEAAVALAREIGYPLVVRPSYVLGGRAMEVVHADADLERYMREAVKVSNDSPVLLDRFLDNAVEVDIDVIADSQGNVLVGGVMQHIEEAGVHSGDSSCSLPPYSLSASTQARLREQVVQLAALYGQSPADETLGRLRALLENSSTSRVMDANRQRLEAEAIRDGIMAVSGDLDLKAGGSILPPRPGMLHTAHWQGLPDHLAGQDKVFRKLRRRLLPGFALVQRADLLRERLAVDAGMGVEIRLKKWRLQPEFVYSLGLNNLHNISNTPYDWVVGRIIRDRFTLRLLIWRAEK